jgi:AcrR family transcriptional regulator
MIQNDQTVVLAAKPMNPRRTATRARIGEAANRLFFEKGFALVTMEQVALAADIQRSTLYLHFREKDDILAAIADDYTAKLRKVVARLPGPKPTRSEIAIWVGEFATFVSEERAATELLVSLSHLPNSPSAAVAFGQALLAMMAERLAAIRDALEPGNHMARAWMIAVMDTLGWALCDHARHGVTDISQARLAVSAEGLYRFVRGEL